MDLLTLGIPDIRVRNYGSRRAPLEMVEAPVHLPAWDGYLVSRREDGREIADGTVLVRFACNMRSPSEYWEHDVAAYHSIIEHQHATRDAIAAATLANITDLIGYLDPEELGLSHLVVAAENPQSQIPNPKSKDLRSFIGPSSVAVTEHTRDGLPYVEWHLNCTWDDEHGLAAVTHGARLIDLDRGEIDIYKIFADNGTLEEELKHAERYRNQPNPTPPKPWWKFW